MDKTKLIKKVALYLAYALFAGFSAYFTATSLSLNLLHTDGIVSFIIVYLLVFIVAIMAGWCLTNVIEEFNKTYGASKAKFAFSIIGFLIFWGISFTTNVHFFFIEKHGFSILGQELSSAKNYIVENTDNSNRAIDDQKEQDVKLVQAQVTTNLEAFEKEIESTLKGNYGFGDACITILNSTEDILTSSNALYDDKNTYVIYDEINDAGDKGTTQRSKIQALYSKYAGKIIQQLNKKLDVISKFYDRKKNQNKDLLKLLQPIADIENNHYPRVAQDGSANAYFKCQQYQQINVIDKMTKIPDKASFAETCIEYNSNGDVEKINVYPSARMFETMTVWGDMFHHRLPEGMPMIQWIIISLIFDIMAFLLFALAKLIK
ncbi:MAG: CvpA family protein [Paludibacteraceae bacterium]|nr:CvpA family protein [Paludibacteraceae bacterium]